MKTNPRDRLSKRRLPLRANNDRKKNGWAQIFLFIIFLILLALVLNGMGWCIGGVCEVGTDMLLK